MSDPTLYREKLLKPAVLLLGKGADQEDETLRVLSLRALGSMALGAPKKVPPPLPPSLEARGAGCGARSPRPRGWSVPVARDASRVGGGRRALCPPR